MSNNTIEPVVAEESKTKIVDIYPSHNEIVTSTLSINGIVFMTESGDLYSGFYNVATDKFIGFIPPVTDDNTKLKEIESSCIEWFAKMPSSENKSTKKNSRTVIKLNAKSKIEAKAALDLMSQTVENIKTIMNPISLTVEITNEEEEK